jgi:hypothetical protein
MEQALQSSYGLRTTVVHVARDISHVCEFLHIEILIFRLDCLIAVDGRRFFLNMERFIQDIQNT